MKKRISLLMIFAVLFGLSTVNAAETPMEEVLKTVKERIGGTDSYEDFDSNMYDGTNGTVYSFSWQKNKESYERLYVSCTQSGIITEYSDDSAEYSAYGIKFIQNRISAEDAVKKAQQLADELNPSLADELIVEMPKVYTGYRFNIKRIKNGLDVISDGGTIVLDDNAEKICSYRVSVTENHEFLSADNLIGREDAIKKYSEKLGMELEYAFNYNYNRNTHKRERTLYLQHAAKNDEKISAYDGEPVIPSADAEMYKNYAAGAAADTAAAEPESSIFSEAEQKELEAAEGLLTKEQLINIAKEAVPTDGFETDWFGINKDSYYSDVPPKYTATITFVPQKDDSRGHIYVTLDAATGEVTSFDKYPSKEDENKLPEEQLKTAAEESAKKLAGAKFNEYKAEEYGGNGYFTYVRYVNGIKFKNDRISVALNRTTGETTGYSINYTDISFPSAEGAMNKLSAEESLFSQVEYKPVYIKTADKKFIPAYDFTDGKPLCTDAVTGELLENGKPYQSDIITYGDIKNHYAEKEITALAELGHGFKDGSFKPEENITQKDFLVLLSGRDPEDVYEFIEPENAGVAVNETAYITKEDAAKILVYNLGNGMFELAQTDIFKSPFADVTENVGFAAILKGKGVVSGDENGLFCPNENLTRANAAMMIYKYFVSNGHD